MILTKTKSVKEVVQTIEVETPLYLKYGNSFYKIVEDGVLWVHNDGKKCFSQFSNADEDLLYYVQYGHKINADEFDAAFCEVHNRQAAIQLQKAPDLGKYDLKKLAS